VDRDEDHAAQSSLRAVAIAAGEGRVKVAGRGLEPNVRLIGSPKSTNAKTQD
jgi:hypothetical protein